MNFWTVYRRVLGLLAPERTLVVWLAVANIALVENNARLAAQIAKAL